MTLWVPVTKPVWRVGDPRPPWEVHKHPGSSGVVYLLDYNDGTFTRSSEASQYGNFSFPDGADDLSVSDMTWAGTNVARIYAADGSVLIEEARTNEHDYSEDLSSWTGTSTTLVGGQTAPDGVADAYEEQFPSDTEGRYRTQAYTTSVTYTMSFFAKDGGDGDTMRYRWGWNGGTGGTLVKVAESMPATWTRYNGVATPSAGTAEGSLFTGKSGFPDGGDPTIGAHHVQHWGHQQEQGAFPTSYIRTPDTASVTRAIDTLQMDASGWDTTIATGHWEVDVWPLYASTEVGANRVVYWSRTTTQYVRIMSNGDVRLDGNGQNPVVSGVSWDRYDKLTIRVDHATGTIGLRVNGGSETTTTASATTWTSAGALWVGHNGAGTAINARISRPRAA